VIAHHATESTTLVTLRSNIINNVRRCGDAENQCIRVTPAFSAASRTAMIVRRAILGSANWRIRPRGLHERRPHQIVDRLSPAVEATTQ
jgi:hypothetical protein